MRKALFAACAFSWACLAPCAASAASVTFDWSYSGSGSNTGSGILTATNIGGITYGIDTISGTANGQTIGGLDDLYNDPDNAIMYPNPLELDSKGFSFSTGAGSFNIYQDDVSYAGSNFDCHGVYCLAGPGTVGIPGDPLVAVSFSLTPAAAVPEPLTLSLLGAGLAGLATLRRRKRA